MATTFQGGPGKAPAQRAGPAVARAVPAVSRQATGAERIVVASALIDGRRRAGADPRAMLALQRQAGNAAVGALMAAKLKSPGEQAVSEIDAALTGIGKSDRAIGTIEKGPGAASTTGLQARGTLQRFEGKPAAAVAQRSCRTSSSPSSLIATSPEAHEPSAVTTGPVAAEFASNVSVQRGLWGRIVGGVSSLAGGIRDRVLGTLSGFARRMPGYELLSVILGRDVVSAQPVTRNAAAIIGGVLALIPGGAQMRENLQQAGAIERAGAWFDAEIPKLGLSWDAVRGLFRRAWDALGASDLLSPTGAWQKIAGIFGPPLARLRDFAVAAGSKVLEFIFEGVLSMAGSMGGQVMAIVRRAGGVIQQIFRDPVGFAGNLIAALRGGLSGFMTHIGSHLRNGLIGWLTGSLGGIIRLPARLDLRGILGMALDFLGITWQRVRGKLVTLIGERALGFLERGAGIVHDLFERGLGAITDRIAQFTSGIVETVLGGIREWVQNSVVGAAITRLLSMFNPAGAIIQAILAVYNTVKFFIERSQQLGALADSIVHSIAAVASGGIGAAVRLVEQALGRAVPVVLGFLSRLIGVGDIAGPVRNVMGRVHTVIDSAIDRVVGWIAGLARRVGGALRGGGRPVRGGTNDEPESLRSAVAAGHRLLRAPGATPSSVNASLGQLRGAHGLRVVELLPGGRPSTFHIHIQRIEDRTMDVPLVVAGNGSTPAAALNDTRGDVTRQLRTLLARLRITARHPDRFIKTEGARLRGVLEGFLVKMNSRSVDQSVIVEELPSIREQIDILVGRNIGNRDSLIGEEHAREAEAHRASTEPDRMAVETRARSKRDELRSRMTEQQVRERLTENRSEQRWISAEVRGIDAVFSMSRSPGHAQQLAYQEMLNLPRRIDALLRLITDLLARPEVFEQVSVGPGRAEWPEVSAISPDWAGKGAHIHVDDVELRVTATSGGLLLEPVFSSDVMTPGRRARFERARRQASAALEETGFQKVLYNATVRAIQGSETLAQGLSRPRTGTLPVLARALRRSFS